MTKISSYPACPHTPPVFVADVLYSEGWEVVMGDVIIGINGRRVLGQKDIFSALDERKVSQICGQHTIQWHPLRGT